MLLKWSFCVSLKLLIALLFSGLTHVGADEEKIPPAPWADTRSIGYVGAEAGSMRHEIRQWYNDSQIFDNRVLQPLRENLAAQDCEKPFTFEKSLIDYFSQLLEQLRTIKVSVNSKSYILLRDIVFITAEELVPYEDNLDCKILNRWEFLEAHLRAKIELVGNVFLILE